MRPGESLGSYCWKDISSGGSRGHGNMLGRGVVAVFSRGGNYLIMYWIVEGGGLDGGSAGTM